MKNLSRKVEADFYIFKELVEAGIELVEEDRSMGEVPYTITGKIGNWTFTRSWSYWWAETESQEQLAEFNEKLDKSDAKAYAENHLGDSDIFRSYSVRSQEDLNALASFIRSFYNLKPSEIKAHEVLKLYDKYSTKFTDWEVASTEKDVQWFEKMPTILYPDGTIVNKLIVAIKNESEVHSIAKLWKTKESEQERIAQYFFRANEVTHFNYGHVMAGGKGYLVKDPEVDIFLRPHFDELKALRPKAADSLELCLRQLEQEGVICTY